MVSIGVLLVDDHAVVRDGLRALLERESDMQVLGDAGNGREAVAQVLALQPRVVVMDIAMPELDGIEAARQIRDCCPSSAVILLSMYSSNEHVFRALQAGVRGYLLKEAAGDELVKAIRAVAAGHRYMSEEISERMVDDYIRNRQTVEASNPLERLSRREREILQLLVEGKSNNEVAQMLTLSPKTVNTYRSRLMNKLNISNMPDLVKFAIQQGLTNIE